MRAVVAGGSLPASRLALAGALAAAYLLGACWVFARVHRHAVRTGLIARYSAESVG
jgi:ABC-2 type transport system permease protein